MDIQTHFIFDNFFPDAPRMRQAIDEHFTEATASDIDYVAPPSSIPYISPLQGRLPGIDPVHGVIPGYGNPHQGPVIRFEPK